MKRVLIIDDEKDVRATLRDIIEDAGYAVFEAADGEEGQRMFLADPVDLVITDILMPEREGLETIAGLRKAHPDLKIIAISGGGNKGFDYLRASEVFGANRTLQKPFSPDELLRAIQGVLTGSHGEDRVASGTLA